MLLPLICMAALVCTSISVDAKFRICVWSYLSLNITTAQCDAFRFQSHASCLLPLYQGFLFGDRTLTKFPREQMMCRSRYRLNPMNTVSDTMDASQEFYLNIELVETCKAKTAVNLTDFRSGEISICGRRGGLWLKMSKNLMAQNKQMNHEKLTARR